MARLNEAQKRFIVRRIACFVSLKTIREEFEKEFALPLSEDQASHYDPTTAIGERDLGDELKQLFEEERERYLTDERSIPIAHRAVRLRLLNDLAYEQLPRLLESKLAQKVPTIADKIIGRMQAVLEQAAKETGGLFQRPKPEDEAAILASLVQAVKAHVKDPDVVEKIADEISKSA